MPATVTAFGFKVNPGTIADYLAYIREQVDARLPTTIFYQNLHSLYFYLRNFQLRALFDQATLMVDGMPIVALLRLAGQPAVREQRVTWVDFIWPLLECCQTQRYRVFYFGAPPGVLEAGLERIRARCPQLEVTGHHGYIDMSSGSPDSRRLVEAMNTFQTDVCIVGLGTPRQEQWVHEYRSQMQVHVVLTAGACIEYLAGAVQTPPRWMGRWGLEWAFRLGENPRRFAHRYLLEPWVVLALLVRNSLRSSAAERGASRADHGSENSQ